MGVHKPDWQIYIPEEGHWKIPGNKKTKKNSETIQEKNHFLKTYPCDFNCESNSE